MTIPSSTVSMTLPLANGGAFQVIPDASGFLSVQVLNPDGTILTGTTTPLSQVDSEAVLRELNGVTNFRIGQIAAGN